MAYTLKIGKGDKGKFEIPFGSMEAAINSKNANLTIKEFAQKLANQFKIKNGTIKTIGITFSYTKSIGG